MNRRFEGDFLGYQNIELFYQGWECPNPKGSVILVHGQAEHSECYDHFAQFLNTENWNVYALDLRGHGKSSGQRGYALDFDEYEKDVKCFYDLIKKKHHKHGHLVLFGHSMGGLISIKFIISYGNNLVSALTLSSPALGLSVQVPAYKDLLAEKLGQLLPRLALSNGIDFKDLSTDPKMLDVYRKDSLRHDRISTNVYLGMKNAFQLVVKFNKQIQLPLLMQISGQDRLVSKEASISYFNGLDHIQNKKLLVYNKSYHEILNDVEKSIVMKDYIHFINNL